MNRLIRMKKTSLMISTSRRRIACAATIAACLTLALSSQTQIHAQTPTQVPLDLPLLQPQIEAPFDEPGVRVDTGLFSIFGGHVFHVNLTELGDSDAVSHIRIVIYDAAERVVFRSRGDLRRGHPVQLDVPLLRGIGRVRLRASVSITGQPLRGSQPVIEVEDVDPLALTIEERFSCSAPTGRDSPVTICTDGGVITEITIGS
jgi:hypothetical protein